MNLSTEVPDRTPPALNTANLAAIPLPSAGSRPLPSSPSDIALALKTSGDKQAALSAIRRFAANNPSSFPDMVPLLKSFDPDLSMLGAEGLASLGTKEAATELTTQSLT